MVSAGGAGASAESPVLAPGLRRLASPLAPRYRARIVGLAAATGLVATYALTWTLWQPREEPPNFPAIGVLRSFDFAIPLTLAAVSSLALPRAGAALHAGVLALALLGDQTRIQPELVSLAILLLAAGWPSGGITIARWHLITLWAWAGFHKIVSGGWPADGARLIAAATGREELRLFVAVAVPLCELGLAALALSRRGRRVLRWAAPIVHLGIVVVLLRSDLRNTAVWPWNLSLALIAPLVFADEEPVVEELRAATPLVAAACVAMALYPAGFYVGITDAYLAHNLYSANTQAAAICTGVGDAGERCSGRRFSTIEALNVPLPPERRLFSSWFERVCRPGEKLKHYGVWTRLSDRKITYTDCPRTDGDGQQRHSASVQRPAVGSAG